MDVKGVPRKVCAHAEGRVTYQEVDNLVLRTNESFRNKAQEEHHKGTTLFCDMKHLDMVTKFPVDYMHQVCLGVMRTLLLTWIRGSRQVKWSAGQVAEVSLKLTALQRFIPSTFARKPRSLDEIDRWKATEFRQFLLYTGKIVLKDILRPSFYEHFMALNVAMCILVSPKLTQEHLQYAQNRLLHFVDNSHRPTLYGARFLVYNVHAMLHIADDVQEYGSLDNFSAFPFENFNHKLKKMVRSGKQPLTQIVKRISEFDHFDSIQGSKKGIVYVKQPNNAYIVSGSSCCEVVSITNEKDDEGSHLLMCRVYRHAQAMFMEPCDSRIIGAYKVTIRHAHMELLPERVLERKAMMIPKAGDAEAFCIAILHAY